MWWRREKKEISDFLYQLLVARPPSKGYAKKVAERMQVPYPTLAKYWLGKRRFPASLVKPLFIATDNDQRVADFFLLEGSDYRLARRQDAHPPSDLARSVVVLAHKACAISARYLEEAASAGQSQEGSSPRPPAAATKEELVGEIRALVRHAEALGAALEAGRPD